MANIVALLLLASANLVHGHFRVAYPPWRADSSTNSSVTGFNQYIYPCAGVPTLSSTNRTDWPIDGGSVVLNLSHPWDYMFINLGLGANVTNFNYSLTPSFLNVSGNGTLCIEKLPLPVSVTDGAVGSIQIVTVGSRGSALYNCADIRFSAAARTLGGDQCKSNNVTYYKITPQASGSSSNGSTNATAGGSSAAVVMSANMVTLMTMIGLAVAFCLI